MGLDKVNKLLLEAKIMGFYNYLETKSLDKDFTSIVYENILDIYKKHFNLIVNTKGKIE